MNFHGSIMDGNFEIANGFAARAFVRRVNSASVRRAPY
jgi:hypothetical protein